MNKCEPCKHYTSTNDFYYHCDVYNSFFGKQFAEMRQDGCEYFKEKEQETMEKELKFKVGDNVKVIQYSHSLAASGMPKNLIGKIFEITKVDTNQTYYPYQVGFIWFKEDELEAVEKEDELVEEKKEPKFKVGDRVRVLDIDVGTREKYGESSDFFVYGMKDCVGNEYIITEVNQRDMKWFLIGAGFKFHESWLELVEEKKEKTCEGCKFYCEAKHGFFCEEDPDDIEHYYDTEICVGFEEKEEKTKTCKDCKFYEEAKGKYYFCSCDEEYYSDADEPEPCGDFEQKEIDDKSILIEPIDKKIHLDYKDLFIKLDNVLYIEAYDYEYGFPKYTIRMEDPQFYKISEK